MPIDARSLYNIGVKASKASRVSGVKAAIRLVEDTRLEQLGRAEGLRGRTVGYAYGPRSRVMSSTSRAQAVKLADGQGRGWVVSGKFIGERDLRQVFGSIDATTVVGGMKIDGKPIKFRDLWDTMSRDEKARVAETLRDFDWDAFWAEFYDPDTRQPTDSKGREALEELLGMLRTAAVI